MSLEGKGFFIWKIRDCENGDRNAIANLALQANFTHVLIKVADGIYGYNIEPNGTDLAPPVVRALQSKGLQVWGWHYLYGDNPIGEANKAIQRIDQLNLDGYTLDVEGEYKEPGKRLAARNFMDRLRSKFPNLPLALSSYRFPSYHPQVPWDEFLEKCDYNMPQVYWQYAHNPSEQLTRSVREFQSMTPHRPIVPTGSAYKTGGWSPARAELKVFMETAKSLNLSAANFWEWANCRRYLPEVWEEISDYEWATTPLPQDIVEQYIAALNTREPDKVVSLYSPTAVHVTSARTVQGIEAIRAWYQYLFTTLLPGASITLTGYSGTGSSRHLTWTATSQLGNVNNGSDTFGLFNEKIAYHYTFFTLS